jgi:hypothetical protein
MIELKKREDESYLDWKYRLIIGKLNGDYDIDWSEIKEILDLDCSTDHLRKIGRGIFEYHNYLNQKGNSTDVENKIVEFQKSKYQYQDQKREYNNLIRLQARFEHLKEEIHRAILQIENQKPLHFEPPSYSFVKRHGVALFSDWHYGADIKNSFNTYNNKVFRERVETLTSKIIEYGKRNDISSLTVADLGDLVNGIIHVSTRVQSSEDVISQIQVVSEVLSEVIARLANEFGFVKVINVIGNHGRAVANKSEALLKENFEYIIPWYLESRLRDFTNVKIITDKDGFVADDIFGNKVVYAHGNFDNVNDCAKSLPQLLGFIPSYIFVGHIHHNFEKDFGSTTVIANGSLMGADDFAIQKRFFARPMQKFMVFNEDGCESCYNIYL